MSSVLKRLDPRFRLVVMRPPPTEAELERWSAFALASGTGLPLDFLALLRAGPAVEMRVEGDRFIRFWAPENALHMTVAHHLQTYIPGGLAIGDDEGEVVYVLMTGPSGYGIHRTSFDDPDPTEAVFVASSVTTLLVDG